MALKHVPAHNTVVVTGEVSDKGEVTVKSAEEKAAKKEEKKAEEKKAEKPAEK